VSLFLRAEFPFRLVKLRAEALRFCLLCADLNA